jgi:hypothetical protein
MGIRRCGYRAFFRAKKFSFEQVPSGSDDCREDDPACSLIQRRRSLMFLESFDQFAMLSLYPIDARFMSIQSGVSRVGSLIDSTHF